MFFFESIFSGNVGIFYFFYNWYYVLVLVSRYDIFLFWVIFFGVKNLEKFDLDWIF